MLPERENEKHIWIVDPTKHSEEELKYFTTKETRFVPNPLGKRFISRRVITVQLLEPGHWYLNFIRVKHSSLLEMTRVGFKLSDLKDLNAVDSRFQLEVVVDSIAGKITAF